MPQMIIGDLVVDVVRKKVKNFNLGLYPPDGQVRLSVPWRADKETIRLFVLSKMDWIKKHQAKFQQREKPRPLEFVTGETHYFQGKPYLLQVVEHAAAPRITLKDQTTLELKVPIGSTADQREHLLLAWYRQQLKQAIPPLIEKWSAVMGVQVNEWGVKQMKTRWGSCNIKARRIWLNLELARKSPPCLEYIIVHELVHLLERGHNQRFYAFMDQFLPHWRLLKEELNRSTTGILSED
ncbi:MAG: M48 family metallopeptidase [Chloroflexi bacterium]|nr:M48 family metallopeptidase [Chloroflexota bacterium]MBP8055488.1 M48 family metallopeptidase [Chloroflexota bacterium]